MDTTVPDCPPTAVDHSIRRRDIACCAVLVLLSIAVRWPALGTSLWIDELHTSWVVAGDWRDVAWRARQGNQSPLYFWLLRGWVAMGGVSELTLRLPSLMAGTGLVLGVYVMVRGWTGMTTCALLAGLFLALDSRFIFYSTEARPYALLQLVALWHLGAASRRWSGGRLLSRFELTLSGMLLFHLHYTGALLWTATMGITLLPAIRNGVRKPKWRERLRGTAVDFAAILLLAAPALPHVLSVLGRRSAWQSFVPDDPRFTDIFTTLHSLHFITIPLALWGIRIIVGKVSLSVAPGQSTSNVAGSSGEVDRTAPHPSQLGPVLLWWLAPAGIAWLATRMGVAGLFFPRYLIGSATGPVTFAALILARLPGPRFRILGGLGTLLFALWLDGYVLGLVQGSSRPLRREDWRGLVATLPRPEREETPPLLLLRSGLIEADGLLENDLAWAERQQLREYCRFAFSGIYRLPGDTDTKAEGDGWIVVPLANQVPMAITPELRRLVQERTRFWLVLRADRRKMQERAASILDELGEAGERWSVERQWDFGNVRLLDVRPKPLG